MSLAQLEICVDGIGGLAAAVAGRADRVELCSCLKLGGLTPSAALVAAAVATGLAVHAMVRPRPGDFCYSAAEVALIADEIRRLADMGVRGVVYGAHSSRGELDYQALGAWRRAAGQLMVTVHRAIDMTPDLPTSARIAAECGADWLLTSGGASTAWAGRAVIAQMVASAPAEIGVVAAAGITAQNAGLIVRETGVRAIHASARKQVGPHDAMLDLFGFALGPTFEADAEVVRDLRRALRDADR